ncbi:L-histidine N(alpha)-methyltransferase [Robertkochia sediminum]|uniref:L-histidine N(alpha)-methyltransferase n=1 Tax=Robertkochia sediminum TaxID=2785326 RepID=UPI0019335D83|nr:L-histidine N(alpha)-methyltransferase [Robertkochia sediminum]MBL7472422.1 L-histidine N(alpha)-methyltransferase [Robertkochia sediminum]
MKSEQHPITVKSTFEKDVFEGLTAYPKYLLSKYIYDKRGDALFQEIMALPEYYLTRAEYDLLDTNKRDIAALFEDPDGFDLIELGAGDGKKTKLVLSELLYRKADFTYIPIDISLNALDKLTLCLKQELPELEVQPGQGMYFDVLKRLSSYNRRKKVIMVLGSNIGNLLHPKAIEFLKKIKDSLSRNDLLFMGFDQKKEPSVILNAYNDPTGVTAAFNKNLLVRINRELDANFDIDNFKHWESYDPETGTAKSFLVAQTKMEVTIKKLDLTITFDPWETIHTEISQKYDDRTVSWLANEADLRISRIFQSPDGGYKNYVFTMK